MTQGKWSMLLVDDEEDILVSMKEYLEATVDGLTVLTASSGPDALKLLENNRVNLIITDYKMPGMDGLEFLQRAAGTHPAVPRIILTAFPKLELAIQAINEVEVDRFLTKPIRPEELERVVRSFLSRDARAAARSTSGLGDVLGRGKR